MLFNDAYPQLEQPFDNLYFNNQAVVLWYNKSREKWAVMLSNNILINSCSLIENVDLLKMTSMEWAPANKQGVKKWENKEKGGRILDGNCLLFIYEGRYADISLVSQTILKNFSVSVGPDWRPFCQSLPIILCTGDCHLLGWLVWIPKLMGGSLVSAVKKPCWGITSVNHSLFGDHIVKRRSDLNDRAGCTHV